MKYLSAEIDLTGKVFVLESEVLAVLGVSSFDGVHPERVQVAFHDLANDRIRELIATDDPIKLNEIEIAECQL